ncbi:hypothetical protein FSARC_2433 [Fusarium sarcochroum]|uniref:Uncharacterized protein n=1 Tax=Fusarium sarcochroum TaxID=1208366 RepID=A0A8H4U6S4_9HYPO|nr:hypothetical protein FSARC_2433 [Fusarium sarcochroum]
MIRETKQVEGEHNSMNLDANTYRKACQSHPSLVLLDDEFDATRVSFIQAPIRIEAEDEEDPWNCGEKRVDEGCALRFLEDGNLCVYSDEEYLRITRTHQYPDAKHVLSHLEPFSMIYTDGSNRIFTPGD